MLSPAFLLKQPDGGKPSALYRVNNDGIDSQPEGDLADSRQKRGHFEVSRV